MERRSLSWTRLGTEALLDVRLKDLGVCIEGSALKPRLQQLDEELERKGLRVRPYTWLSTDWFTPDGCTGFAIPFYLAHPRLKRLERQQMLEVEGGTTGECLRILRHEAAHAIDNAFRLRRKKRWRELFGSPSEAYESSYSPDPNSRAHVVNLGHWYSQSHPLEDWAETFAVWLGSGSRWRTRYAGWQALEKLEYVDELMRGLEGARPPVRTRAREDSVSSLRMTLREYYARKQETYAREANPAFDGQLAHVFPPRPHDKGSRRAATFLRAQRRSLVRRVSHATGQNRYLLDHVVRDMIERCSESNLMLSGSDAEAHIDAAILLTSFTNNYLYGAHPQYQR